MSYCTKNDLLKKISVENLAQLTTNGGEVVDDAVVDTAISDATSEIESYLQKQYTVPLSTVPEVIRNACVKITFYILWSSPNKPGMDETVKDNYEKTIAWLRLVAKREVGIGLDPLPASSTNSDHSVGVASNKRVFDKDTLNGF